MSSNLSRRDRMIAAIGGVVVLYALAVGLWFMSQEQAWKTAAKKYAAAEKKTLSEKKLISQRQKWHDAYEEEREKCNVAISQRQAGQQVEAGDVFELPIDVKRWEASISALVKFMHALESEKEAMFDVREISVKPSSHKGYLTGSFKLACAYMRGEKEE